jgi:hypothetical protein
MHRWVAVAVVSLVLGFAVPAQQVRRHGGTTINLATRRPIVARVHAYASASGRRLVDGCLVYEKEIAATESQSGTGGFELQIPADLTNYVVSYCQSGYLSRAEEYNKNAPDGDPVASAPIELQAATTDPNAVARAVQDDLLRVGATLAYLRQANPANYDKIIGIASTSLPGLDLGTLASQLDRLRRSGAGVGTNPTLVK